MILLFCTKNLPENRTKIVLSYLFYNDLECSDYNLAGFL